ncbi:hypothetical protein [Aquipuribacter sp. MA13-6]|uniref:hypothetical protein n=1 Tax=unclassified Aquipuribacter TaxID=2635084 RepID=UPI003EE9D85E
MSPRPDPSDRPRLQPHALIDALERMGVPWLLTGSVLLAEMGARVEPADLDVVPAGHPLSLRRLALALRALEAVPALGPSRSGALTREQCLQWVPPAAPLPDELDRTFVTSWGRLDVAVAGYGGYEDLLPEAGPVTVDGRRVLATSPWVVLDRAERHHRSRLGDPGEGAGWRRNRALEYDRARAALVGWSRSTGRAG